MKATLMFAMLASAAVLTGGEVKIDRYEVLPGNYYKHFGTKLDSDLLPVKDGRTVRKGLLTDGKIRYAPGTGVCYVFWHSKPEDSCVTFSLMLEKPQKMASIQVFGQNLSSMYTVLKASAECGEDEIGMEPAGQIAVPEAERKKRDWQLTIPCGKKAGILKVTVWTGPDHYLNVTEIKLLGESES